MHKIFAAFLISTTALVGTASAKDTYFSIYGGANWNDATDAPGVKEKAGTVVGAAVGTRVPAVPDMRFEVDLSYRTNDVFTSGKDVQYDTTAVLTNVVYDVPVEVVSLRPFVLFGAGFAKTESESKAVNAEESGLAWQLGAGVNWKVSDEITAGVSYRYFQGPELEVSGKEISDGSNDSVVASVSFTL